MYKIVEVVGISPKGYSEAVQDAVDKVTAKGSVIHYFEVIGWRGSVKDGKIAQYQATVKVATAE